MARSPYGFTCSVSPCWWRGNALTFPVHTSFEIICLEKVMAHFSNFKRLWILANIYVAITFKTWHTTRFFLSQLNLLLLLFFSCPAMKAGPLALWHCPAFPLSLCLSHTRSVSRSLSLVHSLTERWHWETAVTWDASRSWQGLRKPRQKGGRGPLSETGGTDLPHSPSLFLLLSLPVSMS